VPLDFKALHCGLESWEPFIEFENQERDKRRSQWYAARRLLWCAEQATRISEPAWDQIDRVLRTIASSTEIIKGQEGWALDCIRVLRQKDAPRRSLPIPVALSDELLRDRGVLATLVLDVVEPGGGQVFQHPKEAVRTYPQADFEQSMQDAWTAAKELAQKGGAQVLFDARWRLQLNEEPVLEVSGRSASGAAARGWWFALTGKVPDEGVIALAQVRADGLLEGVDGVPAKVKAIADDPEERFDTIVVASDENQREAEAALRECGKAGAIRVVNIANE
jgi:hypothetical protein